VALAVLIAVLLLAGCGERRVTRVPAPAPTWRVYSSLPHAGESRDVWLAAVLAFEQHAPRDVEHVSLDSSRPDMAGHDWEVGVVMANARRAAADPRAMAYVGEVASGASEASIPILESAGLAQVAPGGPWAGLKPGHHFVRVIPAEPMQAVAVVNWMRALRTRRLVVIGDGEFPGEDLSALVATNAAAAGIDTSEVTMDPHRLASIRRIAEGVRRAGADTVYFGGIWQNRAVALWGRVHRAAPRARLMGGDGLAEPAFTHAILRSSRTRTYLTSTAPPPPRAFARAFRERFGHRPHPLAVYGHEAMRRALRAVAGTAGSRRAVVDALRAAPGISPEGEVERGRFAGVRIRRDGSLRLARVLVVSGG
jgi:branched-chain amino acid transport system substrate-binding protein